MSIELSHTEFTQSKPEDIWSFWSKPETWSEWDIAIEWCKMKEGLTFSKGAKAELFPKGAPAPVEITIIECVPLKRFVDEGHTPLGKITLSHELTTSGSGINVTHTMKFSPKDEKSKEVFEKGLLKRMEKELPEAVKLLVKLAEKRKT